jgi:hypothetical protein
MKAKETARKLNVSKVTVANLDSKSMSRLLGGSTGSPTTGTDITAVNCKYVTEAC